METPFIRCFEHVITEELCNDIIRRFEKDHRKEKGVVAGGRYDETKKISAELGITPLFGWKDIDTLLYETIQEKFQIYLKDLSETLLDTYPIFDAVEDDGYVVCKYPSDIGFQFWNNHLSTTIGHGIDGGVHSRVFGFIWFLTDTEVCFSHSKSKMCLFQKGSLLLYPVTWTWMYMIPVKKDVDRYTIYGYMSTKVS